MKVHSEFSSKQKCLEKLHVSFDAAELDAVSKLAVLAGIPGNIGDEARKTLYLIMRNIVESHNNSERDARVMEGLTGLKTDELQHTLQVLNK